jgi:hypothetical protein
MSTPFALNFLPKLRRGKMILDEEASLHPQGPHALCGAGASGSFGGRGPKEDSKDTEKLARLSYAILASGSARKSDWARFYRPGASEAVHLGWGPQRS